MGYEVGFCGVLCVRIRSGLKLAFRGVLFVCLLLLAFLLVIIFISFSFTLSSAETAAWVQAFGSIAAIWGAVLITGWQSRAQTKERSRAEKDRNSRILKVLLFLVRSQQEQLRLLHSTLYKAIEDFGEGSIRPYLETNWHLQWPAHIEALRSIDINELDADMVKRLIEMKVGAEFAWSICERLDHWDTLGSRELNEIRMLNHYWEMSGLMVALVEQRVGR
ncbi:hypothetical protein V2J66_07315 [Pseudomonas alliivorans]|uniref:hypothetical protein n=1 Tax=Pseudomonas fragariae (ex Marin et al. 2024) TaxID=3080056 RepID=UPI002EB6BBCA|nr:hypothetical protein [Pseudomonas alliivorans]MEE5126123.1 hypothetical protein [Pseudomonas alliivorans]